MLPRRFKRVVSKRNILASCLLLIVYGTLRTSFYSGRIDASGGFEPSETNHVWKQANQSSEPVRNTVPMKVPKDQTNKTRCDMWFGETIEDNLHVISQYPRGQADEYMGKIAGNLSEPKQMMTSFPVIVTAANSGYFSVTQGLLKSIHEILLPKYKDIKIIYYDLGRTPVQSELLKKYCKCEVRTFPFGDMPSHVQSMKTYTWKPLIVKTLLMEFGWVWWMDSSVRMKTDQLDSALAYSRDNSVLFFTYGPLLAVAQHTDVQTMNYLKEDRCKFRKFGEIEAGFVLFHYDHVTDVLVDAWAACALNSECMCPPGTQSKLGCSVFNKSDGGCHRFDQAVLSILLRRLYHDQNDYPLVETPFKIHEIKRGIR